MYNILLVDDEPITKIAIRKLMATIPDQYALTATASNGLEALELIDVKNIDIVITDLKMPKMNGIELIKQLNTIKYEGVIIVLSNYSDFDLVREALLAGAIDYILKVNVNAVILKEQLLKAAEKLKTIKQSQKASVEQDKLIETSRRIMRSKKLRDFFTEESSIPNDNCILESLYSPNTYNYFWLLNIYLHQKTDKKMPLDGIVELLQSILEKTHADIFPISSNEIICILPEKTQTASYQSIEICAEQITRQVRMYYDMNTSIIIPRSFGNICNAHEKYQLCKSRADIFFYESKYFLIRPEMIEFSSIPDNFNSNKIGQELLAYYFDNKITELNDYINNIFVTFNRVLVRPSEVKELLYNTFGIFNDNLTFQTEINKEALNTQRNLILECQTVSQLKSAIKCILTDISECVLLPKYSKHKKEIQKIFLYMQLHCSDKISLEDIAKSVNLNPSYLCRLFKKETGESVFQHLNKLRLERAANLMRKENRLIKEIAAQVGIDDQFYFAKMFKKHYGMSPTEYQSQFTD